MTIWLPVGSLVCTYTVDGWPGPSGTEAVGAGDRREGEGGDGGGHAGEGGQGEGTSHGVSL